MSSHLKGDSYRVKDGTSAVYEPLIKIRLPLRARRRQHVAPCGYAALAVMKSI
jgi:hypothetical protein